VNEVPNFRYRALTQNGEIVNGTISAPTSAEVARRIEYLRLLPIETVEDGRASFGQSRYGWFGRPTAAESRCASQRCAGTADR
jgi:general secretion pathway protein F